MNRRLVLPALAAALLLPARRASAESLEQMCARMPTMQQCQPPSPAPADSGAASPAPVRVNSAPPSGAPPSPAPAQPAPQGQYLNYEQLQKAASIYKRDYDDEAPVIEGTLGQRGLDGRLTASDLVVFRDYLRLEERSRDLIERYVPQGASIDWAHPSPQQSALVRQTIRSMPPEPRERLRAIRSDLEGKMTFLMQTPLQNGIMQSDHWAPFLMPNIDKHNGSWMQQSPTNPYAFQYSAGTDLDNGDAQKAIADATRAIELDPKAEQAYAMRAVAEASLGDNASASRDAQAALELDPNDATAAKLLALTESHAPTGGIPGAGTGSGDRADSGGVLAAGGGSRSDPYAGLAGSGTTAAGQSGSEARQAQIAMGMHDYAAAIDAATRAIELNPANAQAFNLRAIAHAKSGDGEAALKDAVAGLALDPKSGPLLDTKATALNKVKRYRDALEAANAALESNPNDAYAYRERAEALAGLGDRNAMIESLKKAAALDPRYDPLLQAALQLPAASDTAFLFQDDVAGAARGRAAAAGQQRRYGLVAGAAVVGGFLIALGLLQLLLPPVKEFVTRVTSRSRAAAAVPEAREDGGPEVLAGQFRTLRQIGAGGMGMVYEGTDLSLERRVAIKKMREELRSDKRERDRFVSEAKLVAALHHPNIVDIYSIVEQGDDVYLVFEFVPGKTIHEIVSGKGRLSFGEGLGIFRGMAAALDYAHGRHIIHRDLKPSNVMVSEDGFVKVMDFGIARLAKDALNRFSMTNTVVGTPPYMAPEQEQGVVRRESDVYALGVCLYEMLSGQMPFSGIGSGMLMNKINKNYVALSRQAEGLPSGIDAVMAKALDPDPEQRFHSAKEFLAHLEALAPARARV